MEPLKGRMFYQKSNVRCPVSGTEKIGKEKAFLRCLRWDYATGIGTRMMNCFRMFCPKSASKVP